MVNYCHKISGYYSSSLYNKASDLSVKHFDLDHSCAVRTVNRFVTHFSDSVNVCLRFIVSLSCSVDSFHLPSSSASSVCKVPKPLAIFFPLYLTLIVSPGFIQRKSDSLFANTTCPSFKFQIIVRIRLIPN